MNHAAQPNRSQFAAPCAFFRVMESAGMHHFVLLAIFLVCLNTRKLWGKSCDRVGCCFQKEKRQHWLRSRTAWVEWLWRTWRQRPSPIRFWVGIGSSLGTNLMVPNVTTGEGERSRAKNIGNLSTK